jgi:Sulphur oxidation protein SoxZ
MASALINVPAKAKRGEIITIKTLVSHIMESGFRHTITGVPIPRDIITSFLQRGRDLPRHALPRHRRQPLHHLRHDRHRERHHRVQVGRRQWLLGNRAGQDHSGMSAWRASPS